MFEIKGFKGGFPDPNFIDGDGRDFRPPWPKTLTAKSRPGDLNLTHWVAPAVNEAYKKRLTGVRGNLKIHAIFLPETSRFLHGNFKVDPEFSDGDNNRGKFNNPKALAGLTAKLQFSLYDKNSPIIGDTPVGTPVDLTTDIPLDTKDASGALVKDIVMWKVPSSPEYMDVPVGKIGVISIVMPEGPEKNNPAFDYSNLCTGLFIGLTVNLIEETSWE